MQLIRDHQPDPVQETSFRTALIVTLVGNAFLVVGKGVATYLTGSAALYADTANSISDLIYSAALVFALKAVLRPLIYHTPRATPVLNRWLGWRWL